jgi:hypothetical protein
MSDQPQKLRSIELVGKVQTFVNGPILTHSTTHWFDHYANYACEAFQQHSVAVTIALTTALTEKYKPNHIKAILYFISFLLEKEAKFRELFVQYFPTAFQSAYRNITRMKLHHNHLIDTGEIKQIDTVLGKFESTIESWGTKGVFSEEFVGILRRLVLQVKDEYTNECRNRDQSLGGVRLALQEQGFMTNQGDDSNEQNSGQQQQQQQQQQDGNLGQINNSENSGEQDQNNFGNNNSDRERNSSNDSNSYNGGFWEQSNNSEDQFSIHNSKRTNYGEPSHFNAQDEVFLNGGSYQNSYQNNHQNNYQNNYQNNEADNNPSDSHSSHTPLFGDLAYTYDENQAKTLTLEDILSPPQNKSEKSDKIKDIFLNKNFHSRQSFPQCETLNADNYITELEYHHKLMTIINAQVGYIPNESRNNRSQQNLYHTNFSYNYHIPAPPSKLSDFSALSLHSSQPDAVNLVTNLQYTCGTCGGLFKDEKVYRSHLSVHQKYMNSRATHRSLRVPLKNLKHIHGLIDLNRLDCLLDENGDLIEGNDVSDGENGETISRGGEDAVKMEVKMEEDDENDENDENDKNNVENYNTVSRAWYVDDLIWPLIHPMAGPVPKTIYTHPNRTNEHVMFGEQNGGKNQNNEEQIKLLVKNIKEENQLNYEFSQSGQVGPTRPLQGGNNHNGQFMDMKMEYQINSGDLDGEMIGGNFLEDSRDDNNHNSHNSHNNHFQNGQNGQNGQNESLQTGRLRSVSSLLNDFDNDLPHLE